MYTKAQVKRLVRRLEEAAPSGVKDPRDGSVRPYGSDTHALDAADTAIAELGTDPDVADLIACVTGAYDAACPATDAIAEAFKAGFSEASHWRLAFEFLEGGWDGPLSELVETVTAVME